MKKIILIGCVAALLAWVPACVKKNEDNNAPRVGIGKTISHPSLDAVEKGIMDELQSLEPKIRFDLQNANGDINTAASIISKFKSEKADVIAAIGTPIAVAAANASEKIPIVFAAITDPVAAHLTENYDKGYKNVTGAVDTIPIKEQITEFRKLYPFKKLGFIYTSSEANAVSMAETAAKVCEELGIEFIPSAISNSSEVKQAAESLSGRVDAFYVVNDNSLVAGVNSLAATAEANNIPVFSGDIPSSMNGGMVYALGFDYYELGKGAGRIIFDVLNGKNPADIAIFALSPDYYSVLIDLDAAKRLGLTVPGELRKKARFIIENGKLTDNGGRRAANEAK